MARIFVSHSSQDDEAVTALSDWFVAQGFDDHFIDHLHIPGGASWDLELPQQLNQSDILVLFVTQSWLQSDECLAEYRASYYGGKVIIPLLVADKLTNLSQQSSEELQKICSSVQGISVSSIPPDAVVARLLSGSLSLSSTKIKWEKRRRQIKISGVAVALLAVLFTGLFIYFQNYIIAYWEKIRISQAFTQWSKADFEKRFVDVNKQPVSERIFRECSHKRFCPEMVVIPDGSFRLGASDDFLPDDTELPNHQVDMPVFAVSMTEITQAQWRSCTVSTQFEDQTKCQQIQALQAGDEYPVGSVSWQDAKNYVSWLNLQVAGIEDGPYRLLSETEWEYAIRGITSVNQTHNIYHWGDVLEDACDYANVLNDPMPTLQVDRPGIDCVRSGGKDTHELVAKVGSFKANQFGLFDMAGNLAEWVEDCWHDNYEARPVGSKAWVESDELRCERVIRGGSWIGETDNLRSSARSKLKDDRFGFNIGFRVARDLDWQANQSTEQSK